MCWGPLEKMKICEPLTVEERTDLIRKMGLLSNYPSSQRIFRELFESAYAIVSTKGIKVGWFNKLWAYVDDSDSQSVVGIKYTREFFTKDSLF